LSFTLIHRLVAGSITRQVRNSNGGLVDGAHQEYSGVAWQENPLAIRVVPGKTIIEGDEALKHTRYYKELFGPYENNTIFLDESYQADIPQVRELENKMLIQSFSEEEVQKAVFQMEHNKALRPDGFPTEFYQTC
jgi:hypothetical protein